MARMAQQLRRIGPVLLGALLLAALLATSALAPQQVVHGVRTTFRVAGDVLWATRWAWPLAAALLLIAMISPSARRLWPQPAQRVGLAAGGVAGLIALTAWPRVGLLILGGVATVGLLVFWVVAVPRRLTAPVTAPLDRIKLENDLRTTALQAIAGVAVLVGALLAFQQLTEDRQQAAADREEAVASRELTRQGQASERFTRAIDQLGSDRREVQLGGIYGLEQIAQQAPDNRLAVTEVLVAYLHRRAPLPTKPSPNNSQVEEELRVRAPDVQAALTVLGRRQIKETDPALDLRTLDVSGADLLGADLRGADLRGTDLSGANLSGANLSGANLFEASLGDVANLRNANLSKAYLGDVDLTRAFLPGANLSEAGLSGANFREAYLKGANLRSADLFNTDISGADLSGADLTGAELSRTIASHSTRWPTGFDWRSAGVKESPG